MEHKVFMYRCLELAVNGIAEVKPNPMVGCVIVHNNKIIGEGYHRRYGEAHAEVNAIQSVKKPELLGKSTLYVNLEPCSHFGKTPPCADMIIKAGIPRVVIANSDPFPKVNGSGIQKLEAAGVEVIVGVLQDKATELNKRFFCYHLNKRPYIILKWAQTADGYIDIDRSKGSNKPYWISSDLSKKLVHQWRAWEDAIFVGSNTARNDDPALTVRLVEGRNPLRIVLDRKLALPRNLSVFNGQAQTLVLNELKNEINGNNEYLKIDFSRNVFEELMEILYQKKIQSIMIEGGKNVLEQLLSLGLWDEAKVFHSPIRFGSGLQAPEINAEVAYEEMVAEDHLVHYRNTPKR